MKYRFGRIGCRLLLASIGCLLLSSAAFGAGDIYMKRVKTGLHFLQMGCYVQAAIDFDVALDMDLNATPAHDGLGLTLLLSGQTSKARAEFTQALELDPADSVARSGLAMCSLVTGHLADGRARLDAIHGPLAPGWAESTIAYLERVSGAGYSEPGQDTLGQAIRAGLGGPVPDVLELEKISRDIYPTRFDDQPALFATFDPGQPLSACKVLEIPLRRRKSAEPGKVLSGRVVLQPQLGNRSDVRYVEFHVDRQIAGITNSEPFRFEWDTARYSNGNHTIVITGCTAPGEIVATQTRVVRVLNRDSEGPTTWKTPEAIAMAREMLAMMGPQVSSKQVHYWLGVQRARHGDHSGAAAALEYAVAIDPGYRDARRRLIEAYSPIHAMGSLWSGPKDRKVFAITFDDGPNPTTPMLLDELKLEGVRATFFLVGRRAEAFPDLVKRMQLEGHTVANHSFTHPRMTDLKEQDVEKQIIRTATVVREITGNRMAFFRPPGGHIGPIVFEVLRRYGIRPVMWSVNCGKMEGGSPTAMANYVLKNAGDGGIVLLHNGEQTALHALPMLISGLRQRGYEIVTISEMSSYAPEPQIAYAHGRPVGLPGQQSRVDSTQTPKKLWGQAGIRTKGVETHGDAL